MADKLGKLALTDTGIFRREMQVLSICVAAGYIACVIGGGYAEDLKSLDAVSLSAASRAE